MRQRVGVVWSMGLAVVGEVYAQITGWPQKLVKVVSHVIKVDCPIVDTIPKYSLLTSPWYLIHCRFQCE